jgi:indole-3-glycerol phosphate synthase
MNILEQIIADKRCEVAAQREVVSLDYVSRLSSGLKPGHSLKNTLKESEIGIIAEFKRKSPSKGMIHPEAIVTEVARAYTQAGCSAMSVLTDYPYFGGTLTDFKQVRAIVDFPLLRKDFIIDPYQVHVSKILGADVILLIAACLTPDEAYDLGELAHELGMEVLLEVHEASELDYISRFTDLIGVNNRNLKTFKTDVRTSFELAPLLPESIPWISESGLSDPLIVRSLRESGYRGFLMGEAFMKEAEPGRALASFIQQLKV